MHKDSSFVASWLEILRPSYEKISSDLSESEKIKLLEKSTVLTSIKNLTTFPFIKEAIKNETISLHGLWHDIGTGDLMFFDNKLNQFILV